jgi:HAMP domain-containing protein
MRLRLFRFSPSRLALVYIVLSVLVLSVFALPLWYVWRVNYSTLRTYVRAEDIQRMADIFERDGAKGLAGAIDSRVATMPGDEVIVLADPSKARIAGNVPAWPPDVPDSPGTAGLVIDRGGSSLRVVVSHVRLPGGYHLLLGRESARFQSLVDLFWYGIAGATGVVLVLGAAVGWMIRRALLAEVREITGTASAIADGDLASRVTVRGGSDELDTLEHSVKRRLGSTFEAGRWCLSLVPVSSSGGRSGAHRLCLAQVSAPLDVSPTSPDCQDLPGGPQTEARGRRGHRDRRPPLRARCRRRSVCHPRQSLDRGRAPCRAPVGHSPGP